MDSQTDSLGQQLGRWTSADLISAHQAQLIAAYEQQRSGLQQAYGVTPGKISGTEILTTLAAAIVLLGVVVLIYASTDSEGAHGGLTVVLALGAFLATAWFRNRKTTAAARAASSLAAVGCAALGVGVGLLANAGGVFVTTTTNTNYGYSYSTSNATGDILLGSALVAVLGAVFLRYFAGSLLSLTCTGGVYAIAGSVIAMSADPITATPTPRFSAAVMLVAGFVLLGIARWIVKTDAQRESINFLAVAVTAGSFYLLGGGPMIYLDVLGGVISLVALIVGLQLRGRGLAYAGATGLGGLVVDVGLRNFSNSATVLSIYLISCGVFTIAGILWVTKYLRRPQPAP